MSKEETRFVCSECGYSSAKWMGRCPSCGAWNSFAEEKITVSKKGLDKESLQTQSILLSEVEEDSEFRFDSGISELDRVLGQGIVRASSVLVGGEPGIGKSTLMLQIAANCSARRKVLYVSGEESASQVKNRAERLGLDLTRINILCETRLESVCYVIDSEKPQLVILDSLQTLASNEVGSIAGSVSQIRTCCMEITNHCKANGCTVFFVAHVTKEGTIAGPKIIEHMVDTVLYFEQAAMGIRLIRAAKNRFGSVDEIGIFLMGTKGLEPVSDPAGFFISERKGEELPPGIAYTAICEGTRTFVVEIQALVTDAKTGITRVYSDKIDQARVNRIAAILDRHAFVHLAEKDIYINVAGGVRVNDVSVELAVALAIWSAAENISLPSKMLYFGELSLAGEVRTVSFGDRRLKAAQEMGFTGAMIPGAQKSEIKMNLKRCQKLIDAFKN